MKTTSVLSSLAIALPALAAPAPATTPAAGACPGINRAEFFSNNNIQYTVSCGSDLDTKVLRTTTTEVGLPGCLTACDGTINCTAVSYVPSESDSQKGTCYVRTTGAQHSADPSVAVANRLSPMPTTTITTWPSNTAAARRAASTGFSTTFGGVAIRSGSDIQYKSVNANGTYFWLNRGSETYTPASVPTPNQQNDTLFIGGDNTLDLAVSVPGGQQVYVDGKGRLRFTVPHSTAMEAGSKTTGFSFAEGDLYFENDGFLACNLGAAYDNAYSVYAASVAGNLGDSCVGFEFSASEISGPKAYEYS